MVEGSKRGIEGDAATGGLIVYLELSFWGYCQTRMEYQLQSVTNSLVNILK